MAVVGGIRNNVRSSPMMLRKYMYVMPEMGGIGDVKEPRLGRP